MPQVTLDLVCSTGTTLSQLQCLDLVISDHHAILFTVLIPLPRQHAKRTITFRNTKTVTSPALANLLALHLASDPPSTMADGLVAHYNTALSLSLDSHPPQNSNCLLHLPSPLVHS